MFKQGQVVWDVLKGKGIVKQCTAHADYPVVVCFDNGRGAHYTLDGKLYAQDQYQSLYFSEPRVIAETEPPFEPKLKKGDLVLAVYNKGSTHEQVNFYTVYQDCRDKVIVEHGRGHMTCDKSKCEFYKVGDKVY